MNETNRCRQPGANEPARVDDFDLHAEHQVGTLILRKRHARRELRTRIDGDDASGNALVASIQVHGYGIANPNRWHRRWRNVYAHERPVGLAERERRRAGRKHFTRIGMSYHHDAIHGCDEHQLGYCGACATHRCARGDDLVARRSNAIGAWPFTDQPNDVRGRIPPRSRRPRKGAHVFELLFAHISALEQCRQPVELMLRALGFSLRHPQIGFRPLDLRWSRTGLEVAQLGFGDRQPRAARVELGVECAERQDDERVAAADCRALVGEEPCDTRGLERSKIGFHDLDGARRLDDGWALPACEEAGKNEDEESSHGANMHVVARFAYRARLTEPRSGHFIPFMAEQSETAPLPPSIERILRMFRTLSREEKMSALVQYSRKLEPVPERFRTMDREAFTVPECQTRVDLFPEMRDGKLHFYADVDGRQSPTVAAVLAIIFAAVNDQPASTALALPADFVRQLMQSIGLGARESGLNAMVTRIKRFAAQAQHQMPDATSGVTPHEAT